MAMAAARIMLGASIADLRAEGLLPTRGDGGSLPAEIVEITRHARAHLGGRLGIHTHDSELEDYSRAGVDAEDQRGHLRMRRLRSPDVGDGGHDLPGHA